MASEQPPFHIGRYKVTGKLGSGGMGVVYLATDERLHRRVAIKRLIKNPSSSTAHLRIRQEALLLAQLNHNNIVQIYDVVEERDDVALVMEYVDGSSLTQWQRERAPGLPQKIQLLKQICNGLARAHSAGIIHRDLKADNILVDDSNTAKITDFGIAKNWREDSDLTREQHVAGSWGAMSPEQALGNTLDNRCDLFALGVLAYKLLCGQSPFGDHDSPFVIVDRIVNSQHPPAEKLNPELPPALCQLLDKLLAKSPDKRPLNATAVAVELDAILMELDDRSTHTISRTVTITAEGYHLKQIGRGKRLKALAGAVLAGSAALLVAAAAALLPEPESESMGKYIAIIAPHEDAFATRETRLLGNNVLSAIKQGLSSREGLLLVPYAESAQLRGQSLREQAQALNAQLLLHPSITCGVAHCDASLELIDTANFSVIASRSTTLELEENLETRARTLQQLNYLLPHNPPRDRQSNPKISAADYERYLELFERRDDDANLLKYLSELDELQERNPAFTPLYQLYGELVIDQRYNSRDPAGLKRLPRFLERAPKHIADHPDLITARLRLAIFQQDAELGRKLLDQLQLSLPDKANYHYLTAVYHQQLGNYSQALEAAERALALRTSFNYILQKAMALSALGDMDAAKPLLQRAMSLSDNNTDALSLLAANELDSGRPQETVRLLSSVGLDNLGAMDTYNLCLAYYIERQFDRAEQCFAGVSELAPDDADALLYRAEIADAQQRPDKARQLAEQALAIAADRDDWEGLLMQARAYAELGQAGRAVETLLKIRRTAPDDLYVNFARAQIYITTGDLLSAKAHIRKTLEQGVSPIWFDTARFAPMCRRADFADLRADYPALCAAGRKNAVLAHK
ncbi:serine/threonine-protein kinase [Microbulbifer marinus]|uniref:Serine/threonine protein kinase n=1 Tax=Microbulbifer marinus TaxID=658218 RepID=A0A1H4BB96_9GAMM|nr:serine/threonine-protein kinase [Microbulbifer marinus]SEA45495.1 serine/threonine protein kinase [Microbulbifer marinus]